MVSNASGNIDVSPTTSTELGYVIGIENNIQLHIKLLKFSVSFGFLDGYTSTESYFRYYTQSHIYSLKQNT
jgi:hypothetical protein